MKHKIIPIKGNKREEFIKIIARQFGIIAPLEVKLIMVLDEYDMYNPFHTCKYTMAKLQQAMDCPPSTLRTCLARLDKANVLVRKGKTRWFNASFRGLNEVDCIVFK